MAGSTTQRHRSRFRWIIPAVIAALISLGGVAGNLVATDLDPVRKEHPILVWGFFFVAVAIAVIVAVREYNKQDKSPEPEDEHEPGSDSHPAPRETVIDGELEGDRLVVKIPRTVNALHQLPPPPPDFTGRARELEELMSRIAGGGATISGLQGLGGIGKTTLVLKLAERLAPRYPDAQFYLDLKGADKQPLSPADALAHVIRAYHPTAKLPEAEAELQTLYRSLLHGKRALVLMDNARDAAQVAPLVPPDSCVLLVTSRQHFALPGLFTLNLETLLPEDARKLLLTIAPRIGERADEMAKLCGYLPFALRLAASALAERANLTPADQVRRLSEAKTRLSLVEASLTLSYELLTPEQQKLWRALAVFPDTFDAAAAAAVWQLDADATQDALGDLLKYSLLDFDTDTFRYSLHDLARLFADSRLSDDESHATRMRHAIHYLTVLGECRERYLKGGDAIKSGLALFDIERRNIETGQEWTCQHQAKDTMAVQLCNQYPLVGAYVLKLRQHTRDYIFWLEAALAAARHLKERASEGGHLINVGIAYKNLGKMHLAIEHYEQALVISREISDRFIEASALGNLGNAYAISGEIQRAVEFFKQQLTIAREMGDRRSEEIALGNLGSAYRDLGETRRAIEFYEQALVIDREIGDRLGEGQDLGNLGTAYKDLGELRRAVEFYEQSLLVLREVGDRRSEGGILFNISLAVDELGDRAKAIAYVEGALEIYEQIESPYAEKARAQLAEWRGEA